MDNTIEYLANREVKRPNFDDRFEKLFEETQNKPDNVDTIKIYDIIKS